MEGEAGIEPALLRFCRPHPVPISRTRPWLRVKESNLLFLVQSQTHYRYANPHSEDWHGDKDLNPEKRIWSPPFYRYNYRRMKWCAMRDLNPQAEASEPKSDVYAVPPIAH